MVNDKDAVINKCMHAFCRDCIQKRLDVRNRKCPACAVRSRTYSSPREYACHHGRPCATGRAHGHGEGGRRGAREGGRAIAPQGTEKVTPCGRARHNRWYQ